MATCTHLDQVEILEPPGDIAGCEECLKTGDRWVHLRMCQPAARSAAATPRRTGTPAAHAAEDGHPIFRSVEPGEEWSWCAIDEFAFILRG